MRDMDLGGARAPAPAVTVAAVPAALGARLAPYQRDGVAWILGHLCGRGARSCILADAPGLGKTVQAIAAVAALVARGAARRVLVVAPAGVVGVWEAEFARFAGDIAVAVAGDGDRAAARALAAPGRPFDRLADVGVNVGTGGVVLGHTSCGRRRGRLPRTHPLERPRSRLKIGPSRTPRAVVAVADPR